VRRREGKEKLFDNDDETPSFCLPCAFLGRSAKMEPPEGNCVAYISSIETPYGYRPSLAAGIVFVVLFTLSTVVHIYQLVPTRAWWMIVFVIGGIGMRFCVLSFLFDI
jgi:hypothetical protein